jgi:acyl-CoA thioesterase I
VEMGSNDMLRGVSPAETEKNLRAMLTTFQKDHIPVMLTGMQAQRNLGAEYVAQFDAIYPKLAKEFPVIFYPFFLDGVALNPKLNQADGLHPNPAGVKIIVARMLPDVKKLIAKVHS